MIWTINRIIQNFRTTRGVKFSKGTITHFATKLGYGLKRGGGLVGYDKSVYTALTRVFPDMVEYEKGNKIKKAQKAPKQPIDYNPDKFIEPDRADYEWEKNENRDMRQIIRLTESDLHRIVKESVKKIIRESDTGNFDDFYEGDENQVNSNKNMMYYEILEESNFIYDAFRLDVSIDENEVVVGFFDSEKYGMEYRDYEDPDGSELDSYVLPLYEAWELFLGDMYNEYVSNGQSFDYYPDSLGWFIYHAPSLIRSGKYNIRVEEGSPFGYQGE